VVNSFHSVTLDSVAAFCSAAATERSIIRPRTSLSTLSAFRSRRKDSLKARARRLADEAGELLARIVAL